MSRPPRRAPRGPIEDLHWPTTLEARVVTPGDVPRLHGYDVQDDLVRHYGFAELTLIALTGQAPPPPIGRLFELVLGFLAPCSVAEAPGHSALLVRACGARTPAVLASGAVALSEEAATVIEEHRELLRWLDDPGPDLPDRYRCTRPPEREAVGRFAEQVRRLELTLPILDHDPTLRAAVLAAAHRCGLEDPEPLQAAWVVARLPAVMAEALSHDQTSLRRYPIDLPHYQYIPPDEPPDEPPEP